MAAPGQGAQRAAVITGLEDAAVRRRVAVEGSQLRFDEASLGLGLVVVLEHALDLDQLRRVFGHEHNGCAQTERVHHRHEKSNQASRAPDLQLFLRRNK